MDENKGRRAIVIIIFLIVTVILSIVIFALIKYSFPVIGQIIGCQKDGYVCPDGSVVGRVPPFCEFASCPR